MSDKIYAPVSIKAIEAKFGPILKWSGKADKIIAWINEHKNDKGYINCEITERKSVGEYGDTHSMTLNTWTPKPKEGGPF